MPVEQQCVVIFAGTRGYLDGIDVADVQRFESELLEWFQTRHADQLETIRSSGKLGDEDAFENAIKAFAEQFVPTATDGAAPEAQAQGDAESTIQRGAVHLPEEEVSRDEA